MPVWPVVSAYLPVVHWTVWPVSHQAHLNTTVEFLYFRRRKNSNNNTNKDIFFNNFIKGVAGEGLFITYLILYIM